MNVETLAHIRADVQTAMVENRNDDPALLPDLLNYLLTEIGKVATGEGHFLTFMREWAANVLEAAQLRATSKIPFGERTADPDDDIDWIERG